MRGGAIAIIKASEDSASNAHCHRHRPLISANIFRLSNYLFGKSGVIYVENSRTLQQMPLYYPGLQKM
ncbi:MAG: hypothetical protein R2847_06135 [Bacteroidia bacterium]